MSEFRGSFFAVLLVAASLGAPAYAIEPAPQASQALAPRPDGPFHLERPSAIDLTSPWIPAEPSPVDQTRGTPPGAKPQTGAPSAFKFLGTSGINAQMAAGGKLQYNFSDVKPLGGALAGQVSGNSAKLILKWRDSN